jgi:hypothetical protein
MPWLCEAKKALTVAVRAPLPPHRDRSPSLANLDAQFLTLCSASNLAEAQCISSPWPGLIACKDASLFEAFSCPWTPPSTFYKLLEIKRPAIEGPPVIGGTVYHKS